MMKSITLKSIVRILNWLTVIVVIALIGTATYYYFKPIGPVGHNCTFDDFNCESNINFFNALGCLAAAFIVGAIYGVIRPMIWLLTQHRKKA